MITFTAILPVSGGSNGRRPLARRQLTAGAHKYVGPAGFTNDLYNADALTSTRPAMLVEGELDALTVAQEAGDLVSPVAAGAMMKIK